MESYVEFCPVCENMLYLNQDPEDPSVLVKHCRRCDTRQQLEPSAAGAIKVSETTYCTDDLIYQQYANNRFLRFDPTLPRVRDPALRCPRGKACDNPQPDNPRILFVKYDPVRLKYLYCCDHCGFVWRPEEDSSTEAGK